MKFFKGGYEQRKGVEIGQVKKKSSVASAKGKASVKLQEV